MNVLILNDREPLAEAQLQAIQASYVLYQKAPQDFNLDQALSENPEIEYLVATYNDLSAQQLAKLPALKAIVLTTTAYEYVDLNYCREQGIKVFNNSGYSKTAVAEHLMALLFAAARRIPRLDQQLRQGDFNQFDQQGFELAGKKLGIIGMGRIGQTFAQLAKGLNMSIAYYNRSPRDLPYQQLPLKQLLAESDVLALTLALNTETHHLLNEEAFALMKPGNLIVSIAADDLIYQKALAKALTSGRCFAAGLDLHHPAPELAQCPQLVLTPTKGWYTQECMERRTNQWIQTLNAVMEGQEIHRIA